MSILLPGLLPLSLTVCLLSSASGFISYIVEPLFEEWMRFTDGSELTESMMGHMRKNKARWRQLRQEPPASPLQEEAEVPEDSGTP